MRYNIGDIITNSKMSAKVLEILPERHYRGNSVKFYKLQCLKCGGSFERDSFTAEKREVGCPICTNRKIVPGINDIPTTDPWMVPYFQGGYDEAKLYCSGSSKSIYPKCPVCGRVKTNPMNICDLKRYGGFQCVCHDGKTFPNKFIYGLAEELKRTGQISEFKAEFNLENKKYDMCFPNEMILVEMDSGVNHGHIVQKHKKNKFIPVKTFLNDDLKDDIAKSNDYKIIRIDCYKSEFDYIKANILDSELSKIFNLTVIDWNNILILCSINLVEEVCKYKKDNPEASAIIIASLFNLSDVTVRKYLKMGNELGWCVFTPEIEWQNYLNNRTYYNANPVYVEPDDDEYECKFYDSLQEMERNSIKDFETKIWADTVVHNGIYEKGYACIAGFYVYLMKGENNGIQETSSK